MQMKNKYTLYCIILYLYKYVYDLITVHGCCYPELFSGGETGRHSRDLNGVSLKPFLNTMRKDCLRLSIIGVFSTTVIVVIFIIFRENSFPSLYIHDQRVKTQNKKMRPDDESGRNWSLHSVRYFYNT